MQGNDISEAVLVSRNEDAVRIEINRPEQRNALSLGTLEMLRRAFVGLRVDGTLKYVILTGAGTRCFAAGGDLKELASFRSAEQAAHVSRAGRVALDAIRQCDVPVYAAINGHALGGGAELALACDFRIARAGATMGFLQGKLNITPAWGGAADLLNLVGVNRGLELMLNSRAMNMTEAKNCGLVDHIVPDDADLMQAVHAHAAGFSSKPAHVIQAFARIAHAAKSQLRAAIEVAEFNSFTETWVDEAHWRAAGESLPKKGATDAKP